MRVGCYEDGDYMSYDEAGQLAGYNIDYLEELRRYVDWTYEYVDFTGWAEAYDALESGEIDLLPAVYYTEERTDRMLFWPSPCAASTPRSTCALTISATPTRTSPRSRACAWG